MYDGIMPSTARPAPRDAIGSGNQAVPQQLPVLTTPIASPTGIAEMRWPTAEARVVQLAFAAATAGPGQGFPPVQAVRFTSAGLVESDGTVIDAAYAWLGAVIEYGCGAAAQKIYCDWQPGAINLPPSDFVRVSALAWGSAAFAAQLQVQASIATGSVEGCHVPTCTGSGTWAAGETKTFSVPPGARAIGVIAAGATLPVVTLRGSAWAKFDFSTPGFTPGTYVVDVLDAGVVTVTSDIEALLTLCWYLQP